MRTLRRFYTGLVFSALILSANCTTSESGDIDDDLAAADAGNQIVDVQRDEATDSEIPNPEQVAADARQAAEAAGESIDTNSSSAIQDLTDEHHAAHRGPELAEGNPDEASAYPMAQENKSAQPVSDIETSDSLPSLSQVVAESDTPAPASDSIAHSDAENSGMIDPMASDVSSDSVARPAPAKARKNKVRKRLNSIPSEHLSGNFYIVQPGDTLGQISHVVYGTSRRWQDLATANGLESNSPIYPGDVLRYPADSASSEFEAAYKNLARSKIVVQKGDTLALIAERQLGNQAFWKLLWRWNESTVAEPNRIFEGQSLEFIAPADLAALLSDRKGLKAAH